MDSTSQRPGIRVLVTGGPTRAYLDAVRYLSNLSTGRTAFTICQELSRSADVAAVVGPTALDFGKLQLTHLVQVETNREMRAAVLGLCRSFRPHYVVFSAAVLDFEPMKQLEGKTSSKIKRWNLSLRPAPKIIDEVGERFPKIRRIGFKLETKKKRGSALRRLAAETMDHKKLDGLCLNFLSDVGEASHHAYLFSSTGELTEARTKKQIADWIVGRILSE
jgi:phosphopantothenoylcysteine synthetase/decarboxylase